MGQTQVLHLLLEMKKIICRSEAFYELQFWIFSKSTAAFARVSSMASAQNALSWASSY